MTLIKKISQLHKSATTANLLSMALIMSAVSCGCGDDDKDNKEGEVEITLESSKPGTDTASTSADQELTISLEVKKGEIDPSKWTIATKDLKAVDSANKDQTSVVKPTCNQEGKSLKDAGITDAKLAKDAKKDFKIKILSGDTDFDKIKNGGKVTATLLLKGKKMEGGKETDTSFKTDIAFKVGA